MAFDKKQYKEEMHRASQKQVEEIADYLRDAIKLNSEIRDMRIYNAPTEETLQRIADTPIPRRGRRVKAVADELVHDVFETTMLLQHPRFYSFVASAVSPYSLAGSILTDIYNPHGGSWEISPAACLIEEKLIQWMGGLAGYPKTCGGIFVSGGSIANMSALIAARTARLPEQDYPIGVAYLSDQTHSSVVKGLRMIGFRKDQIVIIPTDDDFRMRTERLEEAVTRDLAAGKKPFVVIGTIGTTNTGSIDPLEEIGAIAQKYHLWFHVDGAYGGSILISDIYRNLAKGIELSDSFSWDTHKWALQTYSCSTLIVKDKSVLLDAFSEHPEYLEDLRQEDHNDPWDLGPEMTRPHRALKLWFTLQAMGTDLLADVIDYAFFNAKLAEQEFLKRDGWEIVSKPMCGCLNVRYAPADRSRRETDLLSKRISERINADGFAFIFTTVIKEKRVLRLCMINGNTEDTDVIETVEYLDRIARELREEL